jgi:hypothetical protein
MQLAFVLDSQFNYSNARRDKPNSDRFGHCVNLPKAASHGFDHVANKYVIAADLRTEHAKSRSLALGFESS